MPTQSTLCELRVAAGPLVLEIWVACGSRESELEICHRALVEGEKSSFQVGVGFEN